MKNNLIIVILVSVFLLSYQGFGQEYLKMMNDPKSNFFDIQKAANDYFDKVGTGKGTRYKQYKRWEHENISKSYPSGDLSRSGPDRLKKEFDHFRKTNQLKSEPVSAWKSLGPDNINTNNGHYSPGLGRVDRIAIDPENENILYIGGPTNGVWKSIDGGLHWESKTDQVGALGVSSIVIDPSNTNKIYWATGDGDNNTTNCTGIYISNNAGESWDISGLVFPYTDGVKGRKLIMHPNNNNELLFSSSKGIYKTIDGGNSWSLKTLGDFDDLHYKTDDPRIVYASKFGEFYRSTDSGGSFTKVDIDLAGRVFISLTPAAPDAVYLMTGQRGIYKSTDQGQTFTFIAEHRYTKGAMWHHGTFIVSPVNEKLIHTGEYETHKSLDGGYSWTKTSNWIYPNNHYIHCDIHDFVYAGDRLYVCTDGGVSYSTDEGASWVNLFNTMVALEPYRMTVCKSNSNLHMNGSQDNGIYLWDGNKWDGIYGADGMECLIDYKNPDKKYFSIQNGEVRATGKEVAQPGKGDWVSPMVMYPTNPSIIYFGNNQVHKTEDGMNSWTVIGTFGDGYVNMMAIGESNPDYLYASKGLRIWRTTNGGTSWTEITNGLPGKWITRIAVHPNDPLKIAVSLGGYTGGEKVYISSDGGTNWSNYSKGLPNIQARCLAYGDSSDDALYLGMDIGIYYIDNTLSEWELYSNGFPLVGVNDLKIHHSSDQVFAASLGRGIWKNATKNAPVYCSASGNTETDDAWISKVELETIENPSNKKRYENFTHIYTSLVIGETYSMHVTLNGHSENSKCFAWIDTNNNKEFESSELISFEKFNEEHMASVTFTVPVDTDPGYYTMRVRNQDGEITASPCGDAIKGEVEDYAVLIVNTIKEYCNASGADGTTDDWIKNVKLNTLDHTSEKSSYSDFTNLTTELSINTEYTLKVTLNYHWDADKCAAWIDYNQNYEFDENELIDLPLYDNANHVYQGKFTVPATSKTGKTRIRVRAIYNNSIVPCSNLFGEVEDYSVSISDATTSMNKKRSVEEELKIYPNPVGSILNVELLSFKEQPSILKIYHVNGKLMFEKDLGYKREFRVPTSSFSPGLYFLKIHGKNKSVYGRFVVQ